MENININPKRWSKRVLIGTPTTGLVRMEWVAARFSQTIPTNWGHVEYMHWLNPFVPISYQVADAENMIAKQMVEGGFEWLLFIEHDNVLPPNTLVKLNQYMIKGDIPVIGALYFTKSVPPEPMVYREWGHGYFDKWKLGDKIWCRGIPFGCTLIHGSIIRTLWNESPEYMVGNMLTRRVFNAPQESMQIEDGTFMLGGTSDLEFCRRCVDDKIFEKAGWPKFQKKKYPFLIDSSIFVQHIDNDGIRWPLIVPEEFDPKGAKPKTV